MQNTLEEYEWNLLAIDSEEEVVVLTGTNFNSEVAPSINFLPTTDSLLTFIKEQLQPAIEHEITMSEAPMLLYAVDSFEVVTNGSNSNSAKKRRQDLMKTIEKQVAVLGIAHSKILKILLELKENCDSSFEDRVAIADYVMICAQVSKSEQQIMEATGCHPLDEADQNQNFPNTGLLGPCLVGTITSRMSISSDLLILICITFFSLVL